MKSAELRKLFLDYFAKQNHAIVASSPLVPGNDPTLLFTNAGMVQFKDVFLGHDKRPYSRATSSQRCVRAGGKHNDLENVGYTARHHTFFEMLGNFSFGDYFKREAIRYAWEFLTKEIKLPAEKLWVTVYEEDHETADIWLKEMHIDPTRFSRCGAKDNFWAMGDTGPCGPCTEIFYDHGPEIPGGPPGTPEEDGDRYIEIWNLVFMQFDRAPNGDLTPLPKPSVDTGMGLERLAAVMQGVHNNYETDLFVPLIQEAAKIAGIRDLKTTSLRVIADHIRSAAFLITDTVIPSNEGRGYVLRRIIRRAVRHGNKLGITEPFFHRLVKPLVAVMGKAYPELTKAQPQIERVLLQEEEQFARTLSLGLKILETDLAQLKGKTISGATVFRLYDTYGFPVDLTADIARERGLALDYAGFEEEMEKQRKQSQEASKFGVDYRGQLQLDVSTDFTGYHDLAHEAIVLALFREGQPVTELQTGEIGAVVLDRTPFYAEAGGQIGDKGLLELTQGEFQVADTRKELQAHIHYGEVKAGRVRVQDKVMAKVDVARRNATRLNHSATHLLHAALRQVLGAHVLQKGSLVEPERLRFDFAHPEALNSAQLHDVELLVNEKIRANLLVETQLMSADEAKNSGAMALFGEKYGDEVRVLRMGDFSKELCGGTHVHRTGDIGVFKITSESGIAAGVRRIEALTGDAVLNWFDAKDDQLRQAAQLIKAGQDNFIDKLKQFIDRNRTQEKQLLQLQTQLAKSAGSALAERAVETKGIKVLATTLETGDIKTLRDTLDQLKQTLGTAVIVLAGVHEGAANIVVGVTRDSVDRIKANEIVNHLASEIGGKGGGRPDMAQAGGGSPEKLASSMSTIAAWIAKCL